MTANLHNMATISNLETNSTGADSKTIINENFDNLNTDKLEKSGGTLTGKIDFSGTTHAGIRLNNLTTAQRDALTAVLGDKIFNTTTDQEEVYTSAGWVAPTGSSDATTSVKGVSELATSTEIDNGTATGGTGAGLSVSPDQLALSKYSTQLPTSDQKAGLVGTSGTPSSSNKYVTNDDTTATPTANKVVRAGADNKIADGWLNSTIATTNYVDALNRNYILAVDHSTQTVTNNNDEYTVFTATIPANLLLASSSMDIFIYGNFNLYRNVADSHVRVKLDATTILDASISNLDGGLDGIIKIKITGITNTTQRSIYDINLTDATKYIGTGTSSVDMTSQKTLTVTLQGNDSQTDFTVNFRELTINTF